MLAASSLCASQPVNKTVIATARPSKRPDPLNGFAVRLSMVSRSAIGFTLWAFPFLPSNRLDRLLSRLGYNEFDTKLISSS